MLLGKKVSISLSLTEMEGFISATTSELADSFLELSTRAFVLDKRLGTMLKKNEGVPG